MSFVDDTEAVAPALSRHIDTTLSRAAGKQVGYVLLCFEIERPGPGRVVTNMSAKGVRVALASATRTLEDDSGRPLEETH